MKQHVKLLLLSALMSVFTIDAKDRRSILCNTPCDQEAADVIRSSGCGKKSKCFCSISACCAAFKSLFVNGVEINSSSSSSTQSVLGYAEYVDIGTTPSNEGIVTAANVPTQVFTIATPVYTMPAVTISTALGGTVFNLTQGTYIIDCEAPMRGNTFIGLYKGATSGSLVYDPNTPGSQLLPGTDQASFVHIRSIQEVGAGGLVVGFAGASNSGLPSNAAQLRPYVALNGVTPFLAPFIRVTFLKIR